MEINEKLKFLRQKKHKTCEEIGKVISKSPCTYRKYEKGAVKPNIYILIKLANYYNVSIDYLCNHISTREFSHITPEQKQAIEKMKELNLEQLENLSIYLKKLINQDNEK